MAIILSDLALGLKDTQPALFCSEKQTRCVGMHTAMRNEHQEKVTSTSDSLRMMQKTCRKGLACRVGGPYKNLAQTAKELAKKHAHVKEVVARIPWGFLRS